VPAEARRSGPRGGMQKSNQMLIFLCEKILTMDSALRRERAAMLNTAIAATQLRDLLRPRGSGEPVNVNVVESVKDPRPDSTQCSG
jgi:hypothetical protein